MAPSTAQASWRAGAVSRHGWWRHSQAPSASTANNASGRPSSTARCSGRLCALSTISQKRSPAQGASYWVMKCAYFSPSQPQPSSGFCATR